MKKVQKRGKRVRALENKPKPLPEDLQFFLEGFALLSFSRSYSINGPNPLALSDIVLWLDIECVESDEERSEAISFIKELDAAYFRFAKKRRKNVNSHSRDRQSKSRSRK